MKIWYEIFVSTDKGTETLAICETEKEARNLAGLLNKYKLRGLEFHVDKWQNIVNPELIESIM